METQQTTTKIVNGVNINQLFETIDSIKENKEIAKFNFRAQNKWINGTENHTSFYALKGLYIMNTGRTDIRCRDATN